MSLCVKRGFESTVGFPFSDTRIAGRYTLFILGMPASFPCARARFDCILFFMHARAHFPLHASHFLTMNVNIDCEIFLLKGYPILFLS